MRTSPRHVASHTGLRGAAALLVVFYHLQYGATYRLPFETATLLFPRSYLWVDLFFVLSGFIISYTNDGERRSAFTKEQAKRFLIARLARIYPLHLFCLTYLGLFVAAVSLVYVAAGRASPFEMWSGSGALNFASELLLIHAWLPFPLTWNIPSWSISAELFAYLMFPLIVGLHAYLPRVAEAGLLGIILLFYGAVAATSGNLDIVSGLAPLRCLAGFGAGMLVYFHRRAIERWPTALLSTLQLAAAGTVVLGLAWPVNDVLLIPAFVLLVAATWPDRGMVARLLGRQAFQFLGEVSYSVYLNHVCLFTIIGFFWGRIAARLAWIDPAVLRSAQLVSWTAIVLIVSYWTFRFVEAPARRAISLRLLGRAPRLPPEVPVAP